MKRAAAAQAVYDDRPVKDVILVTARVDVASLNAESPSIISFDQTDIEMFNVVNPADIINELPQAIATFTPASTILNGAVAGVSFPDLRGLGPERTLVLVNGRRRTLTPGGTDLRAGFDLNALAEPFLERIEVVSGAAGARLSPETVGGALNFVTRTDVQGVEAGARYGVSQRGDAMEASVYALAGTGDDDNGLIAGVNVVTTEGIKGGDRDATSAPYGFSVDGRRGFGPDAQFLPGFGGSLYTSEGVLSGAILNDGNLHHFPGETANYVLTGNGGFEPFAGTIDQLYNWAGEQHFIAPVDRVISMIDAHTRLSPDITAFAQMSFAATRSKIELAPVPTSLNQGGAPGVADALVIDLDNPSVSQSIRDLYDSEFGGEAQALVLETRFTENGNRRQKVNRRYVDFAAGLEFDLGGPVIEATYRFGRSGVNDKRRNLVNRDRLNIALDPSACGMTPDCTPIDLISGETISPEAVAFIAAEPVERRFSISEHELFLNSSFEFDAGLADRARGAVSGQVRHASLRDRMMPGAENVIGIFRNQNPQGSVTYWNARAEIDAPLWRGGSERALDLYLASGVIAASTHGARLNNEVSMVWAPAREVSLFGHFYNGYRPPNIIELYDIPQKVERGFADPCDPNNLVFHGNIMANCLGPSPLNRSGFAQTNVLATVGGVGDPTMDPERIRALSAGLRLIGLICPSPSPAMQAYRRIGSARILTA
ncbi:MAG: TonB-dependent receptor plug domain-containing protein [Parvularculaceae bacterium]